MRIKYVFATKDLTGMAAELEPVLEAIKKQCVDFDGPDLASLTWEDGQALIYIKATLNPKQIEAALDASGYQGNAIVGVNNDTNRVLFDDEINGMYIIGHVYIDAKQDGQLYGEFGQSDDSDMFHTFEGF